MRLWIYKIATVSLLFLGVSSAWRGESYAQTSSSGPARGQPQKRKLPSLEEQLTRLTKVLGLDATQQAKVKTILDRCQVQLRYVYGDGSLSAVDRFNAIQAVHEQANDQINRILSPEQATKFEQIRPHKRPPPEVPSVSPPAQ